MLTCMFICEWQFNFPCRINVPRILVLNTFRQSRQVCGHQCRERGISRLQWKYGLPQRKKKKKQRCSVSVLILQHSKSDGCDSQRDIHLSVPSHNCCILCCGYSMVILLYCIILSICVLYAVITSRKLFIYALEWQICHPPSYGLAGHIIYTVRVCINGFF